MAESNLLSFNCADLQFELPRALAIKSTIFDYIKAAGLTLGFLEYVFCSDEFLLEINKEYLGHDYYTDIISFPLESNPLEANIFISVERVKDNAQKYKQDFKTEIIRVVGHGLLHILGFNDGSPEEKQEMRQQEAVFIDRVLKLNQTVNKEG